MHNILKEVNNDSYMTNVIDRTEWEVGETKESHITRPILNLRKINNI